MRLRFGRSGAVPAAALEGAQLRPGEKPLAAAATKTGAWVIGTRDALHIIGAPGTATTRIPWERVERADWDNESELLRVTEVGEFGQPRPEYTFDIDEPGQLLQLLRERVTASVVLQRRVVVTGREGLVVIARRPPQGTGEITWAYELDAGVDPADPRVMAAAEAGLRAAAEELGL